MDEFLLAQSGDPDDPPPKLLLLLSALYRVPRPAGSTTEYTWQWILHEWKGDRIGAQAWTPEGWKVSFLPSAAEKIDRAAGTLKESHVKTIAVSRIESDADIKLDTDLKEITISDVVEIRNLKLRVDALMRLGMLPPPDAKVVELGQMKASEILSWIAFRRRLKLEDGEWPIEMGRELLPAQRELTRAWREGHIRLRDSRGELVT